MQLISIGLATYNGEKYLAEQLDSIFSQTYKNIEVVVTDDGSTDKTVEILEIYAKAYGLKYFVNEKNIGFVKNFEKVISLCTGEYIALADQDDVWKKDKLMMLYNNIGDAILIHSDAELIDASGRRLSSSYTKAANKVLRKNSFEYFFNNDVTGCTVLFKKKLLHSLLPFPQNVLVHDWWLAICACKNGDIKYLDEPLIFYRQHEHNQIGAANTSRVHSHILRAKAYEKTLLFLQSLYTKREWNEQEKEVLKDLIGYYQAYFSNTIRIRSFFIHLKYIAVFQNDKSLMYRFFSLLLSLFGEKFQEKLWRIINR